MKVKILRVDRAGTSISDELFGVQREVLLNDVMVLIDKENPSKSHLSNTIKRVIISGDDMEVITFGGKADTSYTMKLLEV